LAGTSRRPAAWGLVSALAALLVAAPLLALPLSFLDPTEAWSQVAPDLLPQALRNTLILAAGVGAGTFVLGTSLALLVSFYDFPGRRFLEWALVLPLAMPAYVLTFVLLGQYGAAGPVQQALSTVLGEGARLPDLRTPAGTILVLTGVLYPYVYLLGRAAFVRQSRHLIEVARSLGLSYGRAIVRVALPMARPALAAGCALAIMEALADFGAVNLLGFRAFTDAIYRVWYGAFDRQAALQLAFMLLVLMFVMLAIERALRRRAPVAQSEAAGRDVPLRRLTGAPAAAAFGLPALLLVAVFFGPVVQLGAWAAASLRAGTFDAALVDNARNSLLLAFLSAVLAVGLALTIVYGLRVRRTRVGGAAARVVSVGYALPGTVVAVCVFAMLGWADDHISAALGWLGLGPVVLTGTLLSLLLAYVVRFMALALHTTEAQMARIPRHLDEAARGLGASSSRILNEIHAPLLAPGIATAALLVFVEVMKELPATVLLRPFGLDTLAVAVWEATRESLFETAAFPALLIVAAGLIPVIVLVRLTDPRAGGAAGPPDAAVRR
jgi:iron(III) transport system permease protein